MPVKLSVAIMAHKKRERFVPELVGQLGAEVIWDRKNNRWDTGRRSMIARDTKADWHIVVQDDAVLCRDFVAGVATALEHAPEGPVSFYTGKVRPYGPAIAEAVKLAEQRGLRWLSAWGPIWGPAVAIPVSLIPAMIRGCDRLSVPNYDLRMARYFESVGLLCSYSIPSLVDHRVGDENPSLVPGRSSHPARVAHSFIGDESPLDIDWCTAALPVELEPPKPRARAGVKIAMNRTFGTNRAGQRVLVAAAGKPLPRGFDIEAEQRARATRAEVDYSKLKQPELKALLDKRGIEYPRGVVSNAALIKLLKS